MNEDFGEGRLRESESECSMSDVGERSVFGRRRGRSDNADFCDETERSKVLLAVSYVEHPCALYDSGRSVVDSEERLNLSGRGVDGNREVSES